MKKLGDRWKTQPIGGEITWNWGDLAKFKSFEEVVADEYTRDVIIEQIRNLHCNHLGGITWADFNDPEFKINAEILQKSMGYRYVLSDFSYNKVIKKGKPFDISFKVVNKGSSPFYYNWPIEISLLNSKTHHKIWSTLLKDVNISGWMPGEDWSTTKKEYVKSAPVNEIKSTITIDQNLPDGDYIIAISVLDPAGMVPSLRFANENYFEGGYHPIGYIGMNKKPEKELLDSSLFFDIQNDRSLKYSFNGKK
jgi:hypothetical protein